MTATAHTYELVVHDVDTQDTEEIESVVDLVGECASSAGAELDGITVISAVSGTVVVEVSGHYLELGAFIRRWEDEM